MKKLFIVLGMVAGAIAGFGAAILIINLINLANTSEDSTDSTEFIEATTVNEHEINLSDYDTNIALTEAGEYLLTGEFSHLIKIDIPTDKDAEEKPQVVLKLNNVNINSSTTAIKNIYTNTLFIVTMPKTTNTIISTGDTVVDTMGHLAIDGDGALTVWNQQTIGRGVAVSANNLGVYGDGENIFIGGATTTGAGISTTDRYWIDGGDVTILGTDMLEAPVDNDANRPDT
ncbi:MAG: carbohydrate-binding domain-containing protein, partial [Candidatus Saccharibacteria bacterium]|nr:carbohydrate-binding domain-containing protein [Candidatus Saccharibacteria bacterium]